MPCSPLAAWQSDKSKNNNSNNNMSRNNGSSENKNNKVFVCTR